MALTEAMGDGSAFESHLTKADEIQGSTNAASHAFAFTRRADHTEEVGTMSRSSPSLTLLPITLLSAAFVFAACGDSSTPVAPETPADVAFDAVTANVGQPGPDDWIVVFKPGVADPPGLARRLVSEHGGTLRFTYQHTIRGFAARLPSQALNGIRNNPNVAYVESDDPITVEDSPQTNPPSWGLDRVDQASRPLDDSYGYDYAGAGVTAYILDTGILYTHQDFDSPTRALFLFDAFDDGQDGLDCHGHGTHVAGTVGGATYGVAKAVILKAVRVLDCDGYGSDATVIAGLEAVSKDHIAHGGPSVANMSLSGGFSQALNAAVAASVGDEIVYAVAAGNQSSNACNRSPASTPEAITAGSTNSLDQRSYFSNYGTCVDIFAPGSSIVSAGYTNDQAEATKSGTSMATPHVAGTAALYLEEGVATEQLFQAILNAGTPGVISDTRLGSPNLLLCTFLTDCGDPVVPPPGDIAVQIYGISTVTLVPSKGNRVMGNVMVPVVQTETGDLAGDVRVSGHWTVNGESSPTYPDQGFTDSGGVQFGRAWITSDRMRNVTSMQFCVTQLSGEGYVDTAVDPPECSPGAPPPPPPPPPPLPGAPPVLEEEIDPYKKGKNWRTDLAWSGGDETVVIFRNDADIATLSNSGSYTDNLGKNPTWPYTYLVCNSGSDPEDPEGCSNAVDVEPGS